MSNVPSFPKIYHVGNPAIPYLFRGTVEVTEKIDGSQFGWGVNPEGQLVMRSKGQQIYTVKQNDMFQKAVEQAERMYEKLKKWHEFWSGPIRHEGLYFYGEFLNRPKHNCLAYERIPKNNIALFGVLNGQTFISEWDKLKEIADYLEIDVVPLLYRGPWENDRVFKNEPGNVNQTQDFDYTGVQKLKRMIGQTMSYLGGQLVEGVVMKNYNEYTTIGPPTVCFGKFVSEAFKERNQSEWHVNSGKADIDMFIESFRTEARWHKAIQHLKEDGKLENAPKDIGKLIEAVQEDLEKEEQQTIMEGLYKIYMKSIKRKATAGLAEWYKEQLLQRQFSGQ